MKVISIVDDDYGIMFNNRRVSKDSVLNEHIIKMLDGGKLWLSLYSKQLFGDYENIEVNQEFGFAGKHDLLQIQIAIRAAEVLDINAFDLNFLDQPFVEGIQRIQHIHQIGMLCVGGRIVERE